MIVPVLPDVKKMPLGKLSKLQIAKGLEALIDIEDAIKKNKVLEGRTAMAAGPSSWKPFFHFDQFLWLYNVLFASNFASSP